MNLRLGSIYSNQNNNSQNNSQYFEQISEDYNFISVWPMLNFKKCPYNGNNQPKQEYYNGRNKFSFARFHLSKINFQ